ncbi:hypothetical protein JCM33374_g2005 [Metschnikowia sp. JCM 33374]|nr:hypothetical protein JCM33374_g2005 [Metschnikowia sp. JCM 33374]
MAGESGCEIPKLGAKKFLVGEMDVGTGPRHFELGDKFSSDYNNGASMVIAGLQNMQSFKLQKAADSSILPEADRPGVWCTGVWSVVT